MKGPWKKHEDDVLRKLVQEHGAKNWSSISNKMLSHSIKRLGKQCRERWYNHLSPDVRKDPWTEEEDQIIIEAVTNIGSKWTTISGMLTGRTPNAIKNRWNSTLKRVLSGNTRKRKTPDHHKPTVVPHHHAPTPTPILSLGHSILDVSHQIMPPFGDMADDNSADANFFPPDFHAIEMFNPATFETLDMPLKEYAAMEYPVFQPQPTSFLFPLPDHQVFPPDQEKTFNPVQEDVMMIDGEIWQQEPLYPDNTRLSDVHVKFTEMDFFMEESNTILLTNKY